MPRGASSKSTNAAAMRPFRRAVVSGSLRAVRLRPVLYAAALLLCAIHANAESFVLRDESARMLKLAEGVFVIIHDDATDEWPHGNTGVVVGDDAVLVVDSAYLPSRAKADI